MKLRVAALVGLLAATACAPASAAPVTVDVRVEGEDETVFEGRVLTDGHSIEQDGSGPHPCDGTNSGVNPTPGPTMTSALDDAVAWDGRWTDSLQDFAINRIGPDRNDAGANQFWGYALNWKASELGGCQQQVKAGDDVLFAYDFFSKKLLLRLSGPRRVEQRERFRVRVIDGSTGDPVRGAFVAGRRTNRRGFARVSLVGTGLIVLKAAHSNGVRSNALPVRVTRG
jgi:hypothetical protein